MLADLRDGWREFAGRPWLWAIVVQFSVVNAVVGAADAVYGPLVARRQPRRARALGPGAGPLRRRHASAAPADDPLETAPPAARRAPCASSRSPCRPPRSPCRCRWPSCASVMFVSGAADRGVRRLLDDRAAPGDPRGQAVPGLGLRLVRLGRDGAAGHRAGGPGGERLRAHGGPVGLRRAGRGGHGGGAVRTGRTEPDPAQCAGRRQCRAEPEPRRPEPPTPGSADAERPVGRLG